MLQLSGSNPQIPAHLPYFVNYQNIEVDNPAGIEKLSIERINEINFGETLVHEAIRCNSTNVIKALLKHEGVDLQIKNAQGFTAVDLALHCSNPEIKQLIISYYLFHKLTDFSPRQLRFYNEFVNDPRNAGGAPVKDPFEISKFEIILSLCTLASWTYRGVYQENNSALQQITSFFAGAAVLNSVFEAPNITSKVGILAGALGMVGLEQIPYAREALLLYKTYALGSSAIKGLQHCWKHRKLNPYKAVRNSAIKSVNAFESLSRTANQIYKLCEPLIWDSEYVKQMINDHGGCLPAVKAAETDYAKRIIATKFECLEKDFLSMVKQVNALNGIERTEGLKKIWDSYPWQPSMDTIEQHKTDILFLTDLTQSSRRLTDQEIDTRYSLRNFDPTKPLDDTWCNQAMENISKFSNEQFRDRSLAAFIKQCVGWKTLQTSCTAATQIKNTVIRSEAFQDIFKSYAENFSAPERTISDIYNPERTISDIYNWIPPELWAEQLPSLYRALLDKNPAAYDLVVREAKLLPKPEQEALFAHIFLHKNECIKADLEGAVAIAKAMENSASKDKAIAGIITAYSKQRNIQKILELAPEIHNRDILNRILSMLVANAEKAHDVKTMIAGTLLFEPSMQEFIINRALSSEAYDHIHKDPEGYWNQVEEIENSEQRFTAIIPLFVYYLKNGNIDKANLIAAAYAKDTCAATKENPFHIRPSESVVSDVTDTQEDKSFEIISHFSGKEAILHRKSTTTRTITKRNCNMHGCTSKKSVEKSYRHTYAAIPIEEVPSAELEKSN